MRNVKITIEENSVLFTCLLLIASVLFTSHAVLAQSPSMTTFQARIIKPDGTALESTNVNFTMTYRSHDGACTLYVESFTGISMSGSKGLVALQMGSGTKVYPATAATVQGIFDNTPVAAHRCLQPSNPALDIGTYSNLSATSSRVLLVQFQDMNSATPAQTVAGITINAAPYAWFSKVAGLSHDSEKLGNLLPTDFLKWTDMQTDSCSSGQFLTYNSSGTPKLSCSTPSVSTVSVAAPVVNTGTAANPVIGMNKATGSVDGYLSSADFTTFAAKLSNFSTMTSADVVGALTYAPVRSVAGRTGVVTLTSADITGLGNAAGLNVPTCGANEYLTFNGSVYSCVTDSGSAGTVASVSVAAPIQNTGTATNPIITLNKATSSVDGYLSSADFTTFAAKLSNFSTMTSADVVSALTYAPLALSATFSGDVTGTYNNTSVTKIRGVLVDTTASTPASGDVLRFDGTKYIATAIPSAPVSSVNGRTGVVTITSADITGLGNAAGLTVPTCGANEYLTFNGSAYSCVTDSGSAGTVASVSVAAPIQNTGTATNPIITLNKATGSVDGYLSSADFTTFAAKLSNFSTMTSADVVGALTYAPVRSVAGRTGVVTLTSADITDFASALLTKQDANSNLTTIAGLAPSSGQVIKWDGSTWIASADNSGGGGGSALSSLTAAAATNSIDNLNFNQSWAWSTATTQNALQLNANALTTGSLLNLSSSSNSLNSTNGLLYVGNTGTSQNGVVARIQANNTAGSGLTVLANGRTGIGVSTPASIFDQLTISSSATNGTVVGIRTPGTGSSQEAVIDFISRDLGDDPATGSSKGWHMGTTGHAMTYSNLFHLQFQNSGTSRASLTLGPTNNRLGLGTYTPSTDIGFNGDANKTIGIERGTGAGYDMKLSAGGAESLGSNFNGGNVYLTSGIATGTGSSNIYFQTASAGASGTADRVPTTKMSILGSGDVGIGTATPAAKLEVAGQTLTQTIKITGGSPGPGKVLTSDAAGLATWETPAAGGAGTVTSVTALSPLTKGGTSSDPTIAIAKATGSVDGYLSSTDFTTFYNKLSATLSSPASGDLLKYDGTNWVNAKIGAQDLKNNLGSQQFPNACATNQTMTWSSVTDTFVCTNIAITTAQITGLANSASIDTTNASNITSGTLATGRLPSSVTDALWTANASGDVSRTTGNVGIGTNTPTSALTVNGAIVAGSVSSAVAYIDFSKGNVQMTSTAATTIYICGLKDGGSYTLVLTGVAASSTITVNAYPNYVNATSCSGTPMAVDLSGGANTFSTAGNTNILSFVYFSSRGANGTVYGFPATNYGL